MAKPSTACASTPLSTLLMPVDRRIEPTAIFASNAVGMPSGAKRGLHAYRRLRPVAVLRHVLFARPHQLHRLADLLGDKDRLAHLVVDRPASEAAAEEAVVDRDLFGLEAGSRRGLADAAHRRLRAEPDIELVGLQMHRGVERLHGGVGEMRRFVDRLDDLAALRESIVDIAVIARAHHRPSSVSR